MIIGNNGSGKSSLLNELTPLPSSKDNYFKSGYKEIHIEHNGDSYILINDFTKEPKYSFIVNGEELNLSHNVTIQKELVFKHFNLNELLHNILIGYENFTELSLASRKKLFNTITNLNIDLLLNAYNKLKEELKSNEHLLKSHLLLYKEEERKLLDKGRIELLTKRKEEIKLAIELLLNMRNSLIRYKETGDLDSLYKEYRELENRYKKALMRFYTYLTSYAYKDLIVLKLEVETELNAAKLRLKDYYSILEEIEKKLKLIELNKKTNKDELLKKLNSLTNENEAIRKSITIPMELDPNRVENGIHSLLITLPDILYNIKENKDRFYSKETYEKLINEKEEGVKALNNYQQLLIELEKNIKTLIEHKKSHVTCPKCNYSFSPLYDEEKLTKYQNEYEKAIKEKEALVKKLEHLEKTLNEIKEYFTYYKQYSLIRNNTYSDFKFLWEYIDSNDLIFLNPREIIQVIKRFNQEAIYLKQYKENSKKIDEIKETIKHIDTVQNESEVLLINERNRVNESIAELLDRIKYLNGEIDTIVYVEKIYIRFKELEATLKLLEDKIHSANINYIVDKVIDKIDEELSINKVTLIEVEKELSQNSNIAYTLKSYEKTIEELKSNIKVLNIILDELSPKNGIIAKTVSQFLNVIIDSINAIIDSIWDYKMNLKAIDVEEEVLSYRFKLVVEDKIEISDINLASSGMKEMINLAFRLVIYKLLNLEGYPLYLDEFGNRLDKIHRSRINELVFKFLNSSMYSQVFLVTHLDMNYSVFKDTEVLELS